MPRHKGPTSSSSTRSAKQPEEDKVRSARLDNLVADAEQRVAEQALRYEMAVFNGQDGNEEKRVLRVFEDSLFEILKARTDLSKRYPKPASPGA